jgi:hypothetical protein
VQNTRIGLQNVETGAERFFGLKEDAFRASALLMELLP